MSVAGEKTDVDLLVVGTGNGGLVAALCAYELGVRNVLVIEKSAKYGGTSGRSGGGVWVPWNRYAQAAGAKDSLEEGREYLRQTIPADAVPPELLDTYISEAPKMLDFLHERTRVRYQSLAHYPDYYSNLPGAKNGHRSLEPEPIYRDELGEEGRYLSETTDLLWMFSRIAMTQVDASILVGQRPGWQSHAAKLIWKYVSDIPWVFRHKRSRRLACGCAGITRLRLSMMDRGMPLWLKTGMTELIVEDGKVVGAMAERDGKPIEIRARLGVVLAAGGFEHNQQMREQYLPKPTRAAWSAAYEGNVGDGIRAGIKAGGATRLMNGAWWCTTMRAPDDDMPFTAILEKSLPGSCVVNDRGKRIANESQNYMSYMLELFAKHSDADPQNPSWHIFDARFRGRYFVGPLLTSGFRPDWILPKSYFTSGFLTKADTVAELARKTGIDPAGLEQTIAAMNGYAKTGKDLEFGRGDTEYDRYYGDPTVKPNPCLGPIEQAPFYAMRIEPGDFGTHGGLQINSNAQVLNDAGQPIPGLYAIGNCAAAILPTYPGPGSTLGPAMTFGWQAAKHVAGAV
jgi:3-oxosteroid 1-dehydrogenase